MRQLLLIMLLSIFLFACKHQEQQGNLPPVIPYNYPDLPSYIQHPADNDSLCKKELERAKADVAKGKIVFCSTTGFELRNENQIEQLCKKYDLVYDWVLFSDAIVRGQTQGCYEAFMDQVIEKKFGHDFKKKIFHEADSLLIVSNDTIEATLCDERPHLPGKDSSAMLFATVNYDLRQKNDYMYVCFYIDTTGKPSGYFLDSYYSRISDSINKNDFNELWQAAMAELQTHTYWIPGKVQGHRVITKNCVEINF